MPDCVHKTGASLLTLWIIIFVSALFCQHVRAEESIRVLLREDPHGPIPSEDAKTLGRVNGKAFINGKHYSGSLAFMSDDNGLYVINDLPFEKYIEGVVASETGGEWELEALKTQAVISRTYALFHRDRNAENQFHLTSGVLHQAYSGKSISPLIQKAVRETAGEILTFNDQPIKAFYHSTCEGKTELPEEVWGERFPYFRSVDCNTRNAPYESWNKRFSKVEIEDATGIKGIADITVISNTVSGRVRTLRITAGNGETGTSEIEIKATDFRRLLGYRRLPSTDFVLNQEDGGVSIEGRGWGHGVGLSQWGALEMAKQGKDYRVILSHYYPGTELKKQVIGNR
jgi:stage II sporulation protein D